jgi:ABC-type Fe3+-siderophore transport system permease subunit
MTTFYLFLFAVAGILIHLLAKYRDAYTQKQTLDWKLHLINTAFSVIISGVIVFFKDYIKEFISVDVTSPVAFFVGYFSDSIWKNFTTFYGNKLKAE